MIIDMPPFLGREVDWAGPPCGRSAFASRAGAESIAMSRTIHAGAAIHKPGNWGTVPDA